LQALPVSSSRLNSPYAHPLNIVGEQLKEVGGRHGLNVAV
jgi:hypothetical protein